MTKRIFTLAFVFVLSCASLVFAATWNLPALKNQAIKAVPGARLVGEAQDDQAAMIGLQKDSMNYQFTLSADQEPQMLDARELTCQGHKAYFFEPGMPGSGGLMILLDEDTSLTILCMPGIMSDAEFSEEDLTTIADRMDFTAL